MMRRLAWWATNRSSCSAAHPVALEQALARLHELADRVLEDVGAFLADEMLAAVHRLVGRGAEAPPGGHVQVAGAGAVHLVGEVDDAVVVGWTGSSRTAPAPSPKSTQVVRSW